ncbi:MAG: hypothetical protein V1495_08430 [Pseudomonadota bacterium]
MMKKFLMVACAVAVAGAINSASAMDRSGKIGFGYQENIMSITSPGNTLGTWSLKYGVTSLIAAEFLVGFDMANKSGNKDMAFGARILYNLVQKENSDFYTGLGLVWNQDKSPADNRCLRTQIPLGFEWSFAGLPEIGFNAEAGVIIDYIKATKQLQFHTAGGNIGGALGLGVHYYF